MIGFILGAVSFRPAQASVEAPVVQNHLPMAAKKTVWIEVEGDETREEAEKRVIDKTSKTAHIQVVAPTSKIVAKHNPGAVELRIRQLAKEANFAWPDYLVRLAKCESGLNPKAIGVNKDKVKSKDHGIFQINDYWHPEAMHIAYNLDEATKWTMWRIESGYQYEWMCDKKI